MKTLVMVNNKENTHLLLTEVLPVLILVVISKVKKNPTQQTKHKKLIQPLPPPLNFLSPDQRFIFTVMWKGHA